MISEDDVNLFAAKKLRALRHESGLSQSMIGSEVGVTFQQVQKYEWNINRMSVGRCMQFAEVFGVSISAFFPENEIYYSDSPTPPTTMRFLRLINKIDPKHYDLVYDAIKTIAKLSAAK